MSKKMTKKVMLKDRDVSAKKAKEIKGGAVGGVNVVMCDGSVRTVAPSGASLKVRIADITDGTSNTML